MTAARRLEIYGFLGNLTLRTAEIDRVESTLYTRGGRKRGRGRKREGKRASSGQAVELVVSVN